MALSEEFNKTGNWLFRNRSFLPLILYIFATIVLFFQHKEILDFSNIYWSLSCFIISLTGLGIRILTVGYVPKATSGRNTKKQVADVLNTKGLYSIVRHPLYLGNFFMWLGIILYVGILWFSFVCILLFWLYYERIMYAEEVFIREKFKDTFTEWAAKTPAFIPNFRLWEKTELSFSFKNVLKRENNGLFATIVSFSYLNFIKNYIYYSEYSLDFLWQLILLAGLVIFVFLQILKQKTRLLEVKGR